MYPTAEVRWFSSGALPASALRWFRQRTLALGQEACQQSRRVDHYLVLKETDALGIKLREGRIEVKQRSRQYGVIRFSARVAGRVEEWHKWSFTLAAASRGGSNTDETHGPEQLPLPWIAVHKSRKLCTFWPDPEGDFSGAVRATRSAPNESGGEGCDLELGRIRIGGRAWWTLCLEAFGERAQLYETLLDVGSTVFSKASPEEVRPPGKLGPPFALDANRSYGYPKWLTHPDVNATGQLDG